MASSVTAQKARHEVDRYPKSPDTAEIASLVLAARINPTMFEALYRLHVDAVYRFCYRRLGNAESSADATSQTFIKAFSNLSDCDEFRFRSWLFSIANNAAIDELRSRKPEFVLEDAEFLISHEPTPEESLLTKEEKQTVRELLAFLTPDQRQIVELRLAGLNGAEIAAALGKSRGAVDTAQSRAIARLRSILGNDLKERNSPEKHHETA